MYAEYERFVFATAVLYVNMNCVACVEFSRLSPRGFPKVLGGGIIELQGLHF